VEGEELPEWLRLRLDEPDPGAVNGDRDVPAALPPWLADMGPADRVAPRPAETLELPVWLRDMEEAAPAHGGRPEANPQATSQLPAWLHDDVPELPPSSGPAAPVSARAAQPEAQAADQTATLPAWLRDDHQAAVDDARDDQLSWLQDASPAPPDAGGSAATAPASSARPEAGAASSLPAWLLHPDDPEPATPARASGGSSWLDDDTEERNGAGLPTGEIDDDQQGPHWLRDEPRADAGPGAPLATTTAPREEADRATGEGVPDWLLAPDEVATPPARQPGVPPANRSSRQEGLPDWLLDLDQPVREAPGPRGDWLTDTGPEATAALPVRGLPPWLQELDTPDANGVSYAGAAKGADAARHAGNIARIYTVDDHGEEIGQADVEEHQLPPWLVDHAPPPRHERAAVPNWLNGPDTVGEARAEDGVGTSPDYLGGLDLPHWLHEAEPVEPAPPRQRNGFTSLRQPDSNLPASPRAIEPAIAVATAMEPESAVAAPARPAPERTPERVAAAQLLERLVTERAPERTPALAPARGARLILGLQIAAFALLIAAILVALLGPRLPLRSGTPVPSLGGAAVAGRLAALQPGTPVLVAYEWDARRAAEIAPLEEAVLAHLVERRAALMLMTTDPQGALLSRRRANLLKERRDNFYDQIGLGYVDLGFKPGGEVALARMNSALGSLFERDWAGRDLRGEPVVMRSMCGSERGASDDCSLDRVGLIVVLADESDDVRAWVEQVASARPQVPMTFVAPAEVVPQIRPYFTHPQMSLVSGIGGAYELQALTGLGDDGLSRRVDATAVGGAAFGLLVLAGMLPALWSGRRARRRGKASVWDR